MKASPGTLYRVIETRKTRHWYFFSPPSSNSCIFYGFYLLGLFNLRVEFSKIYKNIKIWFENTKSWFLAWKFKLFSKTWYLNILENYLFFAQIFKFRTLNFSKNWIFGHNLRFSNSVYKQKGMNIFTMFENFSKCRIWIFQFWHFLSIFVLLKLLEFLYHFWPLKM